MNERAIRIASATLAAAGAAVAAYLLYVRQSGGTLACTTGGCETVQESKYAELFGVPVAALALIGFLGLIATAVARGELARLAQAALAVAALLFSAYLLYIQVAVIGAICQWCVATDVVTTSVAILALVRLRHTGSGGAAGRSRREASHGEPGRSRRLPPAGTYARGTTRARVPRPRSAGRSRRPPC